MSKIVCNNCGNEYDYSNNHCPNCGFANYKGKSSNSYNNSGNINTLSIVGFVLSFFTIFIGTIISIVSLIQINKTNEGGKAFAIVGIVLGSIKFALLLIIIIAFIIFAVIGTNIYDDFEYYSPYCIYANDCLYDSETGDYTCSYDNSYGVEEYITCEYDYTDDDYEIKSNDFYDNDVEDSFDYDNDNE